MLKGPIEKASGSRHAEERLLAIELVGVLITAKPGLLCSKVTAELIEKLLLKHFTTYSIQQEAKFAFAALCEVDEKVCRPADAHGAHPSIHGRHAPAPSARDVAAPEHALLSVPSARDSRSLVIPPLRLHTSESSSACLLAARRQDPQPQGAQGP